MHAFCDAVAYRAISHQLRGTLDDLMSSCVHEAQRAALRCAEIVDLAYGVGGSRTTLLSRRDAFFACVVGGPTARAMLHRLPCWVLAQERLEASPALTDERAVTATATPDALLKLWPRASQRHAVAFAAALRTLGRSLRVGPLALPHLAVQTLHLQHNANGPPKALLDEAALAFLRVRALAERVAEIEGASPAWRAQAAYETLARSPVAFIVRPPSATAAAEHAHRRAALQRRALPSAEDGGREDETGYSPPRPTVSNVEVGTWCARRRVDLLDAQRDLPIADAGDALERSMDALALSTGAHGQPAAYMVPPCGLQPSLPLDVAHSAALEDVAVWLGTVSSRATTEVASVEQARVRVVPVGVEADGRARHPHLVESSKDEVRVHLARVPARPAGPAPHTDETVPDTAFEAVQQMLAPGSDVRTGLLRDRTAALLWNVDRLLQVHAVLAARHTSVVDSVVLVLGTGLENSENSMWWPALALSNSIAKQRLRGAVRIDASAGPPDNVREMTSALFEARAVVPLREVCAVLAAVLP
jgi:hypothetical protein